MGFYKLREWVWTETGKGDRWEGDVSVGPSPPPEWPAPPHSLHQPALHGKRPANFICWLLFCCEACTGRIVCSCSSRPVQVGSSAGRVCLQRPCSAGFVCLSTLAIHTCCPHQRSCPRSVLISPPPVHYHVRQDRRELQGLSCWQLQHGPAVAARAPVDF